MPVYYNKAGDRPRVDIEFRRGEQFTTPVSVRNKATNALRTDITAARFGINKGSIDEPDDAFTGFSVTPTVSAGTTASIPLTTANTRLLTESKYCYVLEVDFSTGQTETIMEGDLCPLEEIAV